MAVNVSTLEQTKTKAVEISEKLNEAKATSQKIAVTCAAYRPVAKRGSILFFVMSYSGPRECCPTM